MVFSSIIFLFWFLPVALACYYAAHRFGPWRTKHLVLCLFSYLFYGWSNPLFVGLMLVSTLIDYCCGLFMTGQFKAGAWRQPVPILSYGERRSNGQRLALTISILSNLALLGFFKYFNFGVDSWNALLTGLGLEAYRYETFLRVALPLGISFYTFQSMSYSIDVFRGNARGVRHFIDFACYVSMFPQLVAGPIIRFQEVADQLRQRTHSVDRFARGVAFLGMGLAKKVLLADPCGKVADIAFGAGELHACDAWYGVTGYAFQIYFDFSAYSDMAIGLGLMMGFVFAKNFDSPYHSQSITELWRRWHLSLSNWLRDYLYIPLGGNRKGPSRTYVNLFMVMIFGGLWHGASFNFIVWGGIHGFMLALERLRGRDSFYRHLPKPLKVGITFVIILFTWVFFRAADLDASLGYCASMLGLGAPDLNAALVGGMLYTPYQVGTMIFAAAVVWFGVQTWDFTGMLSWPRALVILLLACTAVIMLIGTSFHPFIYFIF